MLSKSAVGAAWPLADKLAQQGFILAVDSQSPLHELTRLSLANAALEDAMGTPIAGQALADSLSEAVTPEPETAAELALTEHQRAMDAVVDTVARAVQNNIHVARNVAVPLINKVHEATRAALAEFSASDHSPFFIETHVYAAIWNSPVLQDSVARYQTIPPMAVSLRNLGVPAPTDWAEAVRTGAPSYDDEIYQFMQQLTSDQLTGLWNDLFNGGASTTTDVLGMGRGVHDRVLAAYLLIQRLRAEVPTGVNLDIETYRTYMDELAAEAGKAVSAAIQRRERDIKLSFLVYSSQSEQDGGKILVNGDVYPAWLNAGGKPEVLMAAVATGSDLGFNALLAAAPTLEAEWTRLYAAYVSAAQGKSLSVMVNAIRSAVGDEIVNGDESIQAFDKETLHARLAEALTSANVNSLQNLYVFCRQVVCYVFFAHMDVELILREIDALGESVPNITAEEAATFAVIAYMGRWLGTQFTVIDAPGFMRS